MAASAARGILISTFGIDLVEVDRLLSAKIDVAVFRTIRFVTVDSSDGAARFPFIADRPFEEVPEIRPLGINTTAAAPFQEDVLIKHGE